MPFAKVMAERSPALARRTITLHGPGKTYNIAGLGVAWAIIPDPELRQRFPRGDAQAGARRPLLRLHRAAGRLRTWRAVASGIARAPARATAISSRPQLDRMGLPHTRPEVSYLIWIDARALAQRIGNPADVV